MRSPADACTGQRTVGPWHLRLPHFRPDRTPASGDELQTEYFVPWEHAPAAIATVTALGTHIRPVLLLTEIRAVAADRLWLSPFCGRDSLAIHFSWRNDWEAVRAVLPLLEEAPAPHGARPHWGKLFTYPREYLEQVYGASMQRFRDAAGALDGQKRPRGDQSRNVPILAKGEHPRDRVAGTVPHGTAWAYVVVERAAGYGNADALVTRCGMERCHAASGIAKHEHSAVSHLGQPRSPIDQAHQVPHPLADHRAPGKSDL